MGDLGLFSGLGRSPGVGIGYPLQYSGLENSVDCLVGGVTKSRTRLSHFHIHFHFLLFFSRWSYSNSFFISLIWVASIFPLRYLWELALSTFYHFCQRCYEFPCPHHWYLQGLGCFVAIADVATKVTMLVGCSDVSRVAWVMGRMVWKGDHMGELKLSGSWALLLWGRQICRQCSGWRVGVPGPATSAAWSRHLGAAVAERLQFRLLPLLLLPRSLGCELGCHG